MDALQPFDNEVGGGVREGVMGPKGGTICAALIVVTLVASCESESTPSVDAESGPSADPGASSSRVSETPTEAPTVCPHPLGGQCLGELESGRRYRTEIFTPRIEYATPPGWSNMEDLPGNFLLLPPRRGVEGVDAGTVDYLGVYSGATVAAADCAPEPVPGVGLEPEAVVTALASRPGLIVSEPRDVVVGGLKGLVIEIEQEPDTTAGCKVEGDLTIIPLFIGTGPAEVEHAQVPDLRTHLYALDNGRSNVIIEVSDIGRDKRPFDYEQVVKDLRFSPS